MKGKPASEFFWLTQLPQSKIFNESLIDFQGQLGVFYEKTLLRQLHQLRQPKKNFFAALDLQNAE